MVEAARHASSATKPRRGRGDVRVGTSGWVYKAWADAFYPDDLPQREHLRYYAERFPAVEVNNTFYRLPTEKALASWRDTVPPDFRFAIKASRYVTHRKKLKDAADHVPLLTDRLDVLGAKCGVVLFQLPPNWKVDLPRFRDFLAALPERFRYAVEFRDATWFDDAVYDAMRERGVAFCLHDHPDLDVPEVVTSDLVYVRFHGTTGLYRGIYGKRRLAPWAARIRAWRDQGLDVYAFFNNDQEAAAPGDARLLLDGAR